MPEQDLATAEEFKRGWPIILSSAVGIGLGLSPLPFYTIGVFAGPIAQEFGWEPSKVFFAVFVYALIIVIFAPFIGMITDRFGARKIALISITLFGLFMMMQALHNGSFLLYILLWSLVALFGAGTLPITFTKAVNNWFNRHRGKALGIALVSTGIFGALAKYFVAVIIDLYGWRMAYVALGALPILIALPIALVAFRDIDDTPGKESVFVRLKVPILMISAVGLAILAYFVLTFILPTVAAEGWKLQYFVGIFFLIIAFIPLIMLVIGRIDQTPSIHIEKDTTTQALIHTGVTLKQALAEWRFWMLAGAFVVISLTIGAVIPNLEQLLVSKGFTLAQAVGLAVLTGLAVLAGRVIGGFLIDKFWAPAVAFIFLSSPAIALYLLSGPVVSSEIAALSIMMIGFGAGVEYDFLAYLVAKYFGMLNYASIYGALYSCFALGSGFGTPLLSRLAEHEGEWVKVLIYSAIALVIASLPLLTLGKYRYFSVIDKHSEPERST